MNFKPFALLAAGALVAGGLMLVPTSSTQTALANTARATSAYVATYNIDPVHTSVVFGAQYAGMGNFYGQFTDYNGQVLYDGENADSFALSLEIPMESLDTHNEQRDEHLKSPDWFNAKEYRYVTFESTGLEEGEDGKLTLKGDLTLHGVTKPVEATVTNLKSKETPRGTRCGFGAEFKVNRTDFGVDFMLGEDGIGEEIILIIGVQSVKQ